jgi:hypothetical protein
MQACEHLKEKLMLYVYGELDAVDGGRVADHIKNCEGCRNEYRRLSSMLDQVREASLSPQLSPMEARAMASAISRTLKAGTRRTWWRQYLALLPTRLVPAVAMAGALFITIAVIGYLSFNRTPGTATVSQNQSEELMLSDTDLEILNNLELLKEMDAIQKLTRVVNTEGESEPLPDLDNGTRGMRQDGLDSFWA